MDGSWLIVPCGVAVFGLLVVLAGLGNLLRGHVVVAGGRLLTGLVIAGLGLIVALVMLNVQTYARLTHEAPVALVTVKAVSPADSRYDVTVERIDGVKRSETCALQGDEWLVGARVQKWKPWANVLGLDTTYDLDQVTNKYATASRGNGKPITACSLSGTPPKVNAYVPPKILAWIFDQSYTQERRFGSANYMPLADGAVYKVLITQSGLNAEPANAQAEKAMAAKP